MAKDINGEVFNALAEIMWQTGADQQDLKRALEWFETHFFEEDYND